MLKKQKINILLICLVFIGSFFSVMTMVRSGLKYDFGLGFWGPNGHDAIWHLSLINQLKQQIPPANPIYSGTILSNYHWGFDFLVALISNITSLDTSLLYFQILPIIFAILIGLLSYYFVFLVTKNKITSLIFVFLNYFAGSFGWIITLTNSHQIGGESLFWSMQSISTLLNPPFALSLIIVLLGFIFWIKFQKTNSIKWGIITGLLFGLLSGIKIYAGILVGIALSIFWLIDLIVSKKFSKFNFFICLSTGIISFLILLKLGLFSGSNLLELKPFWFTHSMIESVDKFYWPRLASFRFNQTNFLISVLVEIFLVGIFLIGNLGVRVLASFTLIRKNITSKISNLDKMFISILFFSFTIPLLFVQKGTAWNTIQFFYYFLFFANFYLAVFLSKLWPARKISVILLLFVSSMTSIGTLKDYFGNPPPSSLPKAEIIALNFLKNQPSGYVLTYPYDKYIKNNMPTPIPLYAYETTSYVSAFSNKSTFLEDEMNLDITGFNWKNRRLEEEKFFNTEDKFFARGFLINNQIDYIYLVKNQDFKISSENLQIDKIFDQDQIRIYKVRK